MRKTMRYQNNMYSIAVQSLLPSLFIEKFGCTFYVERFELLVKDILFV